MTVNPLNADDEAELRLLEMVRTGRQRIRAELAKTIVGQSEAVDQLLISLFAGGHRLITGATKVQGTVLNRFVSQWRAKKW